MSRKSRFQYLYISCVAVLFLSSVTPKFQEVYLETIQVSGSINDLMDNNCTSPQPLRSKLECAMACVNHPSCLGIVSENKSTCHFLHMCDYAWDNFNLDQQSLTRHVDVARRSCHHGGRFTTSRGVVCHCQDGWVGDYCDRRATNCTDLYGYGYGGRNDVVQIVYNSRLQTVICRLHNKIYGYGLISNSGKYNLSLTWSDYEKGYFIDHWNYWIGLENMHTLTNTGESNKYVKGVLTMSDKLDRTKRVTDIFYYYGFVVQNKSMGYSYSLDRVKMLKVGEPHNTAMENCLDAQNVPFSTWDNDNDFDPDRNCAQLASAGWWFKTCNTSLECNPMGMSAKTLSPPANMAHIAIKGLDMIYNMSDIFVAFQIKIFFDVINN